MSPTIATPYLTLQGVRRDNGLVGTPVEPVRGRDREVLALALANARDLLGEVAAALQRSPGLELFDVALSMSGLNSLDDEGAGASGRRHVVWQGRPRATPGAGQSRKSYGTRTRS